MPSSIQLEKVQQSRRAGERRRVQAEVKAHKAEEEVNFLKDVNERLAANQAVLQEKLERACAERDELSGQLRDLMLHLEARSACEGDPDLHAGTVQAPRQGPGRRRSRR